MAPDLPDAAALLGRALARIAEPLATLLHRLEEKLEDEAEELDTNQRNRIEAARRSVKRRAIDRLTAWMAMLQAVAAPPPEPTPTERRARRAAFVASMFAHDPGPDYRARLTDQALRMSVEEERRLLAYDVPREYWRAAVHSTISSSRKNGMAKSTRIAHLRRQHV